MAQSVIRYRSGRFVAALFAVLGWLGMIVAVSLFIIGLATGASGAEVAQVARGMAWSLLGMLLGQIGRAVFDMAERGNAQAGG